MNRSVKDTGARILASVAAIPYGRVASYGQIAELAGIPRGARLVARALGQASPSSDLPWHRVVGAGGRIAIPATNPARAVQIRRLQRESVPVVDGRVAWRRCRWQPDLDELLWGPVAAGDRS